MFFQRILWGKCKIIRILLGAKKRKKALVIDCGFEAEKIKKYCGKGGISYYRNCPDTRSL